MKYHATAAAILVVALLACAGCRDSQFGGPKVTLSPANPIPRLYPVRLVRVSTDGTVFIEVDGARREFAKGETISTSQGDLRIVKVEPASGSVLIRKL